MACLGLCSYRPHSAATQCEATRRTLASPPGAACVYEPRGTVGVALSLNDSQAPPPYWSVLGYSQARSRPQKRPGTTPSVAPPAKVALQESLQALDIPWRSGTFGVQDLTRTHPENREPPDKRVPWYQLHGGQALFGGKPTKWRPWVTPQIVRTLYYSSSGLGAGRQARSAKKYPITP